MVKCEIEKWILTICFSPLLILFMVKFKRVRDGNAGGFSPLLILFMVKYLKPTTFKQSGFSPLLILFMVK